MKLSAPVSPAALAPGEGVAGPLRLLLAAAGPAGPVEVVLRQAGPRLAQQLDLSLRWIDSVQDPNAALTELATGDGIGADRFAPGWLACLPVDPGLPLEAGGSWAEALGAWRQPTLLLLSSEQMATGLPAALAALALQWRVPLLGLIQWGGAWDAAARRRDGLAWLGWLEAGATPADEDQNLSGLVRRRWHHLELA